VTRPLLVVQNAAEDPPARLGEWLADADVELDVREMFAGAALPPDLTGHSGVLVLGGAMGARDDDVAPWLPAVRELLRGSLRDEVPTLGICLGAQLLAVALGGEVIVGPDGPELGAQLIAKRAASATDALFRELPITPDVIQWHFDVISRLPPGAVLLATSPVYEVQAFRAGRVCWALQPHIETTPETVRDWAASDRDRVDVDLDELVRRSDAAHADVEETWRPFVHRFAEVLRDPASVRAVRSPSVSTATPVDDPAAIRAALAADMQAARHGAVLPLPARRPDVD
jgi:GMP synthase (glutamine-hydrolysing)